jgi:hypothetical protein
VVASFFSVPRTDSRSPCVFPVCPARRHSRVA